MIVCGYSGRDTSVMRAFSHAYDRKGPGTLYWCVQDPNMVASPVRQLVQHARANGRTAYIVPTQGFDDLMVRIGLRCLDTSKQERITHLIANNPGGTETARTPFSLDGDNPTAVLKSNAFEIECPSEVISFELDSPPSEGIWKWVRWHAPTVSKLWLCHLRGKSWHSVQSTTSAHASVTI